MKEVIPPVDKERIEMELTPDKFLRDTNNGSNELYIITHHDSPNTLREIGRLREITFREVGEGTNESIDLDTFDGYYHHLFLWDNEAKMLVGAYRMGLGKNIYKKFGIEGFYVQTLFKFGIFCLEQKKLHNSYL